MDARAKLLGHPIHQMLIVLPLGLLAGVVIFDVVYLAMRDPQWANIAYWLIPVGIISGVVAAIFGVIDWTAIPSGTRARRIGLMHAGANVVALILFAVSWVMRGDAPMAPGGWDMAVAWIGAAMAGVGGWLGGELVDRLGIGVDHGAHADAPNSLTHGQAAQHASR